ncbi:MAG: primosomal protein DnaI [Bacilli bacterium]|nr:primosomal protein DnaI [Bacilli bacterium]
MFQSSKEIEDKIKTNYINALADPLFKKVVNSLDIDEHEKIINTTKIQDTVIELNNCKNCKCLANCKNSNQGYVCYPEVYNDQIKFKYIPCKYKKELLKQEENKMTREKELDNASMKDLETNDKARINVIKWITKFIKEYDNSKKNKGLYLHGNFGSGKTYIIAAAFNELKKSGFTTEIVYFPTLLRDLKANFDELEGTISSLENVDLLLIDDIGAESVTKWSRDEILGTLLQTRMNSYKTTFFTSNYTIDELENHLSNKTDKVEAARIIERIKVLTDDLQLQGENRRK